MDKRCRRNVSRFVSPSYLDVNLVIIVHNGIFHENVLKFQVPVHYICEEEHIILWVGSQRKTFTWGKKNVLIKVGVQSYVLRRPAEKYHDENDVV